MWMADMMSWEVVNVPIRQRASMGGSIYVRSQQEICDNLARNEAEYQAAWGQRTQIIDRARRWGMCVFPGPLNAATIRMAGSATISSQSFACECLSISMYYVCRYVPARTSQYKRASDVEVGTGWRIGAKLRGSTVGTRPG